MRILKCVSLSVTVSLTMAFASTSESLMANQEPAATHSEPSDLTRVILDWTSSPGSLQAQLYNALEQNGATTLEGAGGKVQCESRSAVEPEAEMYRCEFNLTGLEIGPTYNSNSIAALLYYTLKGQMLQSNDGNSIECSSRHKGIDGYFCAFTFSFHK